MLEAGNALVGSWPHYYDSLTLFSPARYSALPGLSFPGSPEHYPHRDEVVDYLSTSCTPRNTGLTNRSKVNASSWWALATPLSGSPPN
ncbi:hypothetical protein [Lentzea sp. NBRC 102530]|uniref:hypothetical protein n=1 Tax=Lentzea sp. NBRC 102530 TaxID=3032201 RepID=UPI0024A129BC|nr:hypothetical protein Lesp01_35700 [Lentzea sp. NBRC 102530]